MTTQFEVRRQWADLRSPWPRLEFVTGWLHRNAPTHLDDTSWIHFDAGQFPHPDGCVTALMDDIDARLEDFVTQYDADREAEITQLIARRVRRQIDLIEPGRRDVRGLRVQPVDRSVLPTE